MLESLRRILQKVPGGKVTLLLVAGILVVLILPPPKRGSRGSDKKETPAPTAEVADAGRATAGPGQRGEGSGDAPTGFASAQGEAMSAADAVELVRRKRSWEVLSWPKDPFWHGRIASFDHDAAGAVPLDSLRLEGTFCGGVRPMAVIDGRCLAVGDTIAGARVRRIRPGEVSLARGRAWVTLRLFE